jgi:hypothetical protein
MADLEPKIPQSGQHESDQALRMDALFGRARQEEQQIQVRARRELAAPIAALREDRQRRDHRGQTGARVLRPRQVEQP